MTSFPAYRPGNPKPGILGNFTRMSPDRYDAARDRIREACADHKYFNPTHRLENDGCHATSCTKKEHETCTHSPDPQQLKADLKRFHDKVWVFASAPAGEAYERLSFEVRDKANDEHSGFDWDMFSKIVRDYLEGLSELEQERMDTPRLGTLSQKGAYICSG